MFTATASTRRALAGEAAKRAGRVLRAVRLGETPLPAVGPPGPRRFRRRQLVLLGIVVSVAALALVVASVRMRGLTGSYFDNRDWAGEAVMTGIDRGPEPWRARCGWCTTDFSVEWSGVLYVDRRGRYRFSLTSDDGSALWIGETLVVDNGGLHSTTTADGAIVLPAGFHDIRIRYMNGEGSAVLSATWRRERDTPGGRDAPLVDAPLFPRRPAPWAFAVYRAGRRLEHLMRVVVAPALAVMGLIAVPWLMARRKAILAQVAGMIAGAGRMATTWPGSAKRVTGPRVIAVGVVAAWGLPVVVAALAAWPQGLRGVYFDNPDWSGPVLATVRDRALTLRRPIYDLVVRDYRYSVEWSGFLYVPDLGAYEFVTLVRGRAAVRVGDADVVSAVEPERPNVHIGSARLRPGVHPIRVRFAPSESGRGALALEWRRVPIRGVPTAEPRPIETAVLFPERPSPALLATVLAGRRIAELWWAGMLLAGLLACLVAATWLVDEVRRWLVRGRSGRDWRLREDHVYAALLVVLAVTYVVVPFGGLVPVRWGFSALESLGPAGALAAFSIIGLGIVAFRRKRAVVLRAAAGWEARLEGHPALVVLIAAAGVVGFVSLRNEFVNSDGAMYRWMLPASVAAGRGEGVNVDEMWTWYLHGRFWAFTNWAFGWSVRLSYQVASSVLGGLFLVVLHLASGVFAPGARLAFFALMLSGGYMQLFFGDVENYAMVTVASLAYYVASAQYLKGRVRLWVPATALSLAMTCHMLAGFLLPSLAFLGLHAVRGRRTREAVVAVVAFAGFFAFTLVTLGVPLERLYQGSWGNNALREFFTAAIGALRPVATEGGTAGRWAWFSLDAYHWGQYALLALMFPGHLLLVPMLLARRVRADAVNVHLLVAGAGLAFFQFNYRALLPVDHDWNLYAAASVPLAIVVWRGLLAAGTLRHRAELALGWGLVSALHSYCWIVANHHYRP